MKKNIALFLLLSIDIFILVYEALHLSISSNEVTILEGDAFSLLRLVTQFFLHLFGNNNLSLRIFMIILHVFSVFLMYQISKSYIKDNRNRLWMLTFFFLLPGTISAALVVSHASIIIFGLLVYIYLYKNCKIYCLGILLGIYYFIEPGFSYLFLALFFYYIKEKKYTFSLYNALLYSASVYKYGFVAHGIPTGHFVDILGVYSAIFSPIIFIYLFYTLYRKYILKETDILWFISAIPFLISLILSFRQKVDIEYFAPYMMMALPLAAQVFEHIYRIRIYAHRKRYKLLFSIAFLFLLLNTFAILFNKIIYLCLDNPKANFIYKMDIASQLSNVLKEKGILCVKTQEDMQKRLSFYGIKYCPQNTLHELSLNSNQKANVTIRYKKTILYKANVTKIHKK